MKLPILKSLVLPMAVIAGLAVASCSRSDNTLLGTVPAESSLVMVIDGGKILDNASCKLSADSLDMPADVARELKAVFGSRAMSDMAKVAAAIDIDHLVAFESGRDMVITFLIDDQTAFDAAMEGISHTVGSKNGYKVYESRMTLLAKDGQGWMLSSGADQAVTTVDRVIDSASKSSMTSHNGVMEHLEAAEAMGLAVNMATFGIPDDGVWLAGNVRLDDAKCMIDVKFIHSDGEIVAIPALKTVDSAFLSYVPSSFNLVAAAGIADPEIVGGWLRMVSRGLSFRSRSMMESILPFLDKVDGTVSVAMKLTDGAADDPMALPGMVVMAGMKPDDVENCVSNLTNMASEMGARVEPYGQGCYMASAPGMRVYIGNIDGKFGISTVPFDRSAGEGSGDLKSRFRDKFAAVSADIPARFNGAQNPAVAIRADVTRQQVRVEISFPDDSVSFLLTLMSITAIL